MKDIVGLIKNNLTIELNHKDSEMNYGYKIPQRIEVKLLFNGEVIDEDEICLD